MRDRATMGPALLCALAWAGCSPEPEPTPQPGDAAAARIKLVDVPGAELLPAPDGASVAVLLEERFSRGWQGWRASTEAEQPLVRTPGVLEVETGAEGGRTFVTLAGARGVLFRIVPVEPSSAYAFSARVRARGLEVGEPFFGATTWLAELAREGGAEELLADGPSTLIHQRHLFPTTAGAEGWQVRERVFVTAPDTRALLVTLNLSFEGGVRAGAVDFADVRLERVPLARRWELDRQAARAELAAGEPPLEDWRGRALVRGHLAAEVRPSALLLPGERLRFALTVPAGEPILEWGTGPWYPAHFDGVGSEHSFHVRIDGEQVWSATTRHAPEEALGDWTERSLDLAPWRGRSVTLELAVEGELPGLFGAPVVRDRARPPQGPNVLLISIDTLRADFVGSYGAPGDPTPRLDAFAAEALRFAHVDGQAPYTLPGHATMFSGQFPSVHGVQRTTQSLSAARSPILARILGERGYRTQAFTGGGLVNADFGFDKGFDGFANIDPLRHRECRFFRSMLSDDPVAKRRLRREGRGPDRITRELIDSYGPERLHRWLAEHRDEAFFLFVHTYSVHDYDPPAAWLTCHERGCTSTRTDYEDVRLTRKLGWNPQPISAADAEHLRHLYDATIRYADHLVGELLDELKRLGLWERTIVAITTDHGEELLERGFRQHGKTLYEELTRLPMILRVPGLEPGVVEEPVMLVDLAPTLLGALGIPRDERMQGRSLLGRLDPERPTWSEIHDDFVHKYALRTADGWKLIHAPPDPDVDFPARREWQLFHLAQDPGERRELSAAEPERLEDLKRRLLEQREGLGRLGEAYGDAGASAIDARTLEQLRELGYVDD